jgi:hypothetical protein
LRAVQSRLRNIEAAVRAGAQRLWWVLLTDRLTRNRLDLSLELGWDVVNVLRTDQNTCPLVGSLLKTSLTALTNRCRHNVDFVVGELTDVLADSDQQASGTHMIIHFHQTFG